MNFEVKFSSDGKIEIWPPDDNETIIVVVSTVVGVVFFAWYGLDTIGRYGGNFVQYLIQYVFTNYLFYLTVTVVIVTNLLLFRADAPVIDFAFFKSIISCIVYIVWGCKAYCVYNVWESMKGLMLPIAGFFGILWMSLFFGIVSTVVCVGIAVLFCAVEEAIEKRAPGKNIKVKKKASEQTVRDYLQLHTDKYGIMYDGCGDVWKCSFCGEWVSMYDRYCDKRTQKRLDTDIVKSFDSHKKKKYDQGL